MRDVAQEVGYSVGTIYNEFENKEALIDGLFERTQEEIDRLLENLSGFCQAPPEMRLRRFIIGYVRAINIKMRQDRAFTELLKEAKRFRHIGIKTMDFGKTVRGKVIGILTNILTLGVREGTFHVPDIPLTAQLVLEAFTGYLIPFLTLEREIDDIVHDAEAMLDLIVKSIRST
jgi:AcrR family transcriptional regulator